MARITRKKKYLVAGTAALVFAGGGVAYAY
jgi:hypothetical protein